MELKLNPPIKWVGGKRQFIKKILDKLIQKIYSEEQTYIEPFLGGGSVLLSLKPKNAIVNDINPYLITMYKVIKTNPEKLIKELKNLSQKNTEKEYYQIRKKGIEDPDPIIQTSILIYLNKTGFRGLYRENSKGKFNVPYGNYKNLDIVQESNLRNLSIYFNDSNIQFFNQDYRTFLMEQVKDNDLIYFDPPYYPMSTTQFTKYTRHDFTKENQIELANLIIQLIELKNVKFLLSNSPADEIKELYKNFEYITFNARRAININQGTSKDKFKDKDNEILINN